MKNKKTPYLDFYKKYYGKVLPDCGLCYSLSVEFKEWREEGDDCWLGWWDNHEPKEHEPMDIFCDGLKNTYFGYDGTSRNDQVVMFEFTPLRQNMVLLLAAMNDEL